MKTTKIKVTLESLADIMFDKFIDHSREVRPPEQKLYLMDENILVFPSENIISFLFGEIPGGCAKTFEGKKSKSYIRTGLGHVFIDPLYIPFIDEKGEKIIFSDFSDKRFYLNKSAPRVGTGSRSVKQEVKERPVLKVPWFLSFQITLVENVLINETKLHNWFMLGGIQISIGTYRPRWGRFTVKSWVDEETD